MRFSLRTVFATAVLFAMHVTPSVAETVAITHARIVTMGPAGEIADGSLVLADGKILAVGAKTAVPRGARIIDAKGGIVTPGLIAVNTMLGLREVNSVKQTDDSRTHSGNLTAAFDVQFGLNPDSTALAAARLGGITRAVTMPDYDESNREHDHLFAGQAAMIHLGQGPDILFRPKIGMVLELGEDGAEHAGGARGAEIVTLLNVLDGVRAYQRSKSSYSPEAAHELGMSRADLEALVPVVEGRMPVIASVHSAADIRVVLKIAREQRLKIILSGAEEAWRVAAEIAAAGVPVLLNATSDLPSRFETLGATMENASRLHAAGVRIAITGSDATHLVREMRYNAGIAVAHGLPWSAALEAVTLAPARIFHVDDRVGSLEPGKDADIVVWSGDPFEPLTQPLAIFVRGQMQPLTSRQLELRDRYQSGSDPWRKP
jgi:imidazolonepropionase-like amidohydrolase